MKKNFLKLNFLALAILALPGIASAQYFTYKDGDLVAGFRNPSTGSYELVANVGNITNFIAQPIGTVIPIATLSSNQLADAFGNITTSQFQWSVSAAIFGSIGNWNGFPRSDTIWFTLPRSSPGTQTPAPLRQNGGSQSNCKQSILSFESGASLISSQLGAGSLGQDNGSTLVREPVNYQNENENYSDFVKDPNDSSIGDYNGNLGNNGSALNIENATSHPFKSASVSDLYQSVSLDHTNSGPADYIGYFTLNTNGVMTFTRATTQTSSTPPQPRITSVTRIGNTSTVFFATTNGSFTYSLYFTNSSGLKTAVTNWPKSLTTVIGNGLTNSLSDTTTATNRFYSIGVQ
ncbi:MAG TPA: hypothetical protein VFV23_02615 [Verrucomicrobiae bacterium]|nr:hypothetical protein [Verrucomicrobiae bacterium]